MMMTEGSSTSETTVCPFCGSDALERSWEQGNGPCEHLVADWATDSYDNGGGALGAGRTDNEALQTAQEFGFAGRELVGILIGDADEEGIKARRAAFLALDLPRPRPGWWPQFEESVRYQVDIGETPSEGLEDLGRFATPAIEAIVEDVPNVETTDAVFGTMAAWEFVFVWSRDRAASTRLIALGIAEATEVVRSAAAKLIPQLQ